jgi:SpoVK/Ycf46/Vps4 family AAA+-type ATPase
MSTVRTIVEKNKAGYPALYILSPEDDRVLGDIEKASKVIGRDVMVWTLGKGLVKKTTKSQSVVTDTENPDAVLTQAIKADQNVIIVLRNFHHFLKNPGIQAQLLDLIPLFKKTRRQVIILTPVQDIPPELEKEFSVVEVELPTKKELEEALDGIAANVPKPSPEVRAKLIEAALGLTTTEAENAFSLAAIRPNLDDALKKKDAEFIWDPAVVMSEKCETAKRTGVMTYFPPTNSGLTQIGGLQLFKNWVTKRTKAWGDEAKAFGLPTPIGVIMLGVPGTGKSLGARATADAFNLPLIRVDMGAIFGGLVGQSEANARMVIKFLEAVSPCVAWLDEIEKGFAGSTGGQLDSGVGARVLGTFLTWMADKTKPVFVYATANNVAALPPELLRKGRFDEMFYVSLPNTSERKEIFEIHLKKRGRWHLAESGKIRMNELIDPKVTGGFSGAEIEAVIKEAMFDSFAAGKDLNMFDLMEAISNVVPLEKMMKTQIAMLSEWCAGRTRPANSPELVDMSPANRAISV